jgi:hypothetical protein
MFDGQRDRDLTVLRVERDDVGLLQAGHVTGALLITCISDGGCAQLQANVALTGIERFDSVNGWPRMWPPLGAAGELQRRHLCGLLVERDRRQADRVVHRFSTARAPPASRR